MRPLRVYVDTSVFGGMFDPEYVEDTRRFFQEVDKGRFKIVASEYVVKEIAPAPQDVKGFFELYLSIIELLDDSMEVRRLTDLYLAHKVLTEKYRTDASHVAYATIYACTGLVSWNFKHIVHPDKCMLFNVVNASQGYPLLFITSPEEITTYGNEWKIILHWLVA